MTIAQNKLRDEPRTTDELRPGDALDAFNAKQEPDGRWTARYTCGQCGQLQEISAHSREALYYVLHDCVMGNHAMAARGMCRECYLSGRHVKRNIDRMA